MEIRLTPARRADNGLLGGVSRSALLCAAFALLPHAAFAQTAPAADPASAAAQDASSAGSITSQDDQGQDVVVTGIRAAINKALDVKRNASSIVDVISAEDIGKLPDDNIAEAVQRIPGVSIDRSGGEGRHISINGLGPQFSLTLFNGRQIATSDSDRSFSFDTIASSLVSQVVVYKTTTADVPEGGLGGTIDVRTAKPFDYAGFKASINASYDYDSNSTRAFPEVSGVISDRFLDGRLGLLLSFNHQKRENIDHGVTSGAWSENYFVDPLTHGYVADTLEDAWRAYDVNYTRTDSKRTRDGGTAVLQFKPTDTLTLTADYLYSKYTVKNTTESGGAYLWAVQNTPQTIRDSNGYYTQLDVSGGLCPGAGTPDPHNSYCHAAGDPVTIGSFLWQYTTSERPTVTQMAGFNAEWNPSSKLKGVFDAYWSQAVNDDRGDDQLENLELGGQPEYIVNFPASGVPTFDLKGNNLIADESTLGISQVYNTGTYVKAINKGASADFNFEAGPTTHFRFGASYADQMKHDVYYQTPTPVDQLYHVPGMGQAFPTSLISGTSSEYGFPIFNLDTAGLRAWMADPANLAKRPADPVNCDSSGQNCTDYTQTLLDDFNKNGGSWTAQRTAASFRVAEKDFSLYEEISQDFKLGSMPGNFVAGVRFSQTSLTSSGTSQLLVGYNTDSNGRILYPIYAPGGTLPVTAKSEYSKFLPSFNAKLNLTPNLLYRVSVTQTMTRPTLGDLSPVIGGFGGTVLNRGATADNPELKPFTSTNYDMSAEWYFSKRGAFALAGFYKDAKNFIITTTEQQQITSITSVPPGLIDPATGAPMTLATLQRTYVTAPHNAASAKVGGITAALTYSLPMGAGFQANYTKVWSSTKSPDLATPFAMPGVSDTANFVLFYEKHGISARAAWNWRSAFLVDPGNDIPGSESRGTSGDAYWQIDARIGYNFGHDLEAAINVVNLTDQKVRYYSGQVQYFDELDDYGRQFTFSVSKKF